MKRLKLTKPNYVGYTGLIGRYPFVDGVSVELIPLNERIRIAGNFGCVEVEEDGSDGHNPSPAFTVVANNRTRLAPVSLKRQSEDEKAEENVRVVMGNEERRELLSAEALEEIASDKGIAGLREIAASWNVKSKSIPVLMQMIVDAQNDYIKAQTALLTKRGIPADEIARLLTPGAKAPAAPEPVAPKPEAAPAPAVIETPVAPNSVAKAAATGDLAAALNAPAKE